MTREECLQKLEEVTSMSLLSAIIFYKSPITGNVEERHIWANANAELIQWLSQAIQNYTRLKAPFAAYLNNGLYLNEGQLFDYKEN